MGLTGRITADQVAKKWDNLKTKFKVTALQSPTRDPFSFMNPNKMLPAFRM